ncbi:MAG: prolipoprotein diacylglyceryl transferase family protein [Pirellulales bacterium]
MLQTLFVIPYEIGGVRIFGLGVLLAAWTLACVIGFAVAIRRRGFDAEVRGYLPVAIIVGLAIFLLPTLLPGGFSVRGYGMMMLLGIVSGVALAAYRSRRFGVDPELIFTLAFWVFVTGIAGARLFYVIEYHEQYFGGQRSLADSIVAMLNISEGGLVVYGAFIAVMIAVAVFVRKYRVPGFALADLIAPSMFLGLAFGRIGCLMNGCCFGGACDLPWSVQFPWGSPPHERQVARGLVDVHGIKFDGQPDEPPIIAEVVPGSSADKAGFVKGDRIRAVAGVVQERDKAGNLQWVTPDRQEVNSIKAAATELLRFHGDGATITIEATAASIAGARGNTKPRVKSAQWTLSAPPRSLSVHPVQIYSAIDALLICLLLLAYSPYHRGDGEVIGLALLVYPIARFLEEEIRKDEPLIGWTQLTISQNVSLLVFAAGIVVWCYILTRPRRLALMPATAA